MLCSSLISLANSRPDRYPIYSRTHGLFPDFCVVYVGSQVLLLCYCLGITSSIEAKTAAVNGSRHLNTQRAQFATASPSFVFSCPKKGAAAEAESVWGGRCLPFMFGRGRRPNLRVSEPSRLQGKTLFPQPNCLSNLRGMLLHPKLYLACVHVVLEDTNRTNWGKTKILFALLLREIACFPATVCLLGEFPSFPLSSGCGCRAIPCCIVLFFPSLTTWA